MSLKISSEKINNPFLVDLLEKLADSFRKMNHDFFIIGATARDIIIQQMLNTSSRRKTRDLDLAIAVPNWQEFDKIKNSLIADGFEKDNCNIPGKNPEFILFLVESIIFKDHTLDCEVMGNKKEWMLLPASKSLFCQPKGIGLPIGDLTSQLFSNIYLNEFDNMIKRRFKIRHYGRYVDDFYVVHPSKAYLKSLIPEIRTFLKERLGLTLHPKKIYLQPYTHGVAFLGAFVKPYRKYAIPRSVNNFRSKAKKIISFSTRDELTIGQLEAIRASLNSYLGYLGHYKSYKIIHKSLTGSAVFKHLYFASGYKKSIPYKRYTNKRRERCEIAHDLNRILTA